MSTNFKKKVLFFPLNSPGHINSCLGIADRLKEDFLYETIFLVQGETIGNTIVEHGHELIMLEETNIYEDYEIESDDDTTKPFDEEELIKRGRKKVKFPGSKKWAQFLSRYQYLVRLSPLESFIECHKLFEKNMVKDMIDSDGKCKQILDQIKPDLIVVDAYYIPPSIVTYDKCPWIKLFSACPLAIYDSKLPDDVKIPGMVGARLHTKEKREQMRQERPEEWAKLVAEWKRCFDSLLQLSQKFSLYEDYLKQNNCPPVPVGKQTHDSPYVNLYMYPKELDFQQDDDILECPPRWLRCDSLVRGSKKMLQNNRETLEHWTNEFDLAVKNKQNSIFFSLGSIASGDYKTMKRFVDTFGKDQNRLYVISKGVNGHKYELNDDNMIGANFIPQTLMLEKVDLAIIHGGNNSVTECLYYGKPMIIMPAFADQIDNAQRIEDLGLGKRLDTYNATDEELFSAINEILSNQELITKCKEIGEKMRARKDAVKASLIVKKLIIDGNLEQSFLDDCRHKDYSEINWWWEI